MNGTPANYDETYARFYLADGSSVTIKINNSDLTNKRLVLWVDINGDNKPNKVARDIFVFNYYVLC